MNNFQNQLRALVLSAPWPVRSKIYTLIKANPWSLSSPDDDFIFIHVPKTAGTALSSGLKLKLGWHPRLEEYYAFDPIRASRSFKFAFVRNPWDRLVSSYHYMMERKSPQSEVLWRGRWLSEQDDFRKFVVKLAGHSSYRKVILSHRMFEPQVNFLKLDNRLAINFVGRLENFADDCRKIFEQLDKPHQNISSVNSSKRSDYRNYFTESWMVDLVEELYEEDVNLLGYSFE